MEYSSKVEADGKDDQPVMGVPLPQGSPGALDVEPGAPVPWHVGLFDCRDDPALCWFTAVCPCVTFGRIAEIVDKGDTITCLISGCWYFWIQYSTCLQCLCTMFYRTKMREQYNLEEAPDSDFCVHFCNEPCALCQEYKELEHRGFDMTIGYEANMMRQRQMQSATAPPDMQGEMMR
ncbi:cell number regulator 2-like [Iris pallida]|uniref:Cell number regulator 2-like n=1 Tax=Iris pallida TaxID=29817 RepID=A0AAX6H5P5_IRIPA|nr:cell number regulator 2-like [Iris pallida]